MGTSKPRNSRGPNSAVSLDLQDFTRRFFDALDADGAFTGPGPVELTRMGYRPAAERFAVTYIADEMFSKYDDGKPSAQKRAKAVERFLQAEHQCALVNQKLEPSAIGQEPWWMDERSDADDDLVVVGLVLKRARSLISRVLGAFPGWVKVMENANFGPGATTRLPRAKGHHAYKWANNSQVTRAASSPLREIMAEMPGFTSVLLEERSTHEIVLGNKLDWVAKNYKTDRTIAIEPCWNMFLQKGVGTLIRRRLKRVGIDLDDQTTNQLLACIGSITGELATIDLSMASDCVAYRLAEFVIRPDWFEAIATLRSPVGFYTLDDVDHCIVYEKLSSMGNGNTFEVETLIFWGIARAVSELIGCADHRLSVYGDDIIVPSGIADEVCNILKQVGFVTNSDKTFTSGPFRESCGAHWFQGVDVKPFYVREAVDSLDRLFLLHNNVCRWFQQNPDICNPDEVDRLLHWIRSHAPKEWRKPSLLSLQQGDGGFFGTFTQVRPRKPGVKKFGWDGWVTDVLLFRSKYDKPAPSRVDLTEDDERNSWPLLSKPDWASLWRLEWAQARWYHGRIPASMWSRWEPSFLSALGRLQKAAADVPYQERYWYEGTLVTPSHAVESVWWA
ncbi:RNA-directed RNA polymerase [ssRNA phage SRR6960799_11]|uniref:RNA-directed RNA polymerase n=1 Tax=ssRNA phage SRR6960799_11 TaxID=2786567 RepID=A0A8S5L014_9VIRU|nr:RNA-directed RNA polymerase [ssRNA phage SRR6960799_11]DAD50669.1 TPA_asm: RNA-directed RNA polymerase [ssRNA phage SRR6960799_11]